MPHHYHAKVGAAAKIPVPDPKPVLTFGPVTIPRPNHEVDIEMRVSVPASGSNLPIVLISHGLGHANWTSSRFGLTPLSDFWAARGFVVIQPTHLDSHSLGLDVGLPWQSRPKDMSAILDRIDEIEATVPTLKGRLDKSKVAIAGHSMGANTAGLLLGMTNTDPRDGTFTDLKDSRITAGVFLAGAGDAADLADGARKAIPFYNPDFSTMTTPTLVVYGDEDDVPLSPRGGDFLADPFRMAPSPKALLRVNGGKHNLGGISTWDSCEASDESPERLTMVQKITWAYLQAQFYKGDDAWEKIEKSMEDEETKKIGSVESK